MDNDENLYHVIAINCLTFEKISMSKIVKSQACEIYIDKTRNENDKNKYIL